MKIVICKGQTLGPISGADETLVTYATQLLKAGVSASALLMFPRPEDGYYLRLRRAGVPVEGVAPGAAATALRAGRGLASKLLRAVPSAQRFVRRGSRRVSGELTGRYYSQCREHLMRRRPDVMHVITPDPSAAVFIRAGFDLGIPVLYQELGIPFHPPEYAHYYRHFTSVLPLCSEVAALSPSLAALCQPLMEEGRKVSVLPVMADDVNGHASRRGRAREGVVTLGFAGRVESIKGVGELMKAFVAARERLEGLRLCVAGDGSKLGELRAQAEALRVAESFQHFGVYEDAEGRGEFFSKIDVLVLPSHTEGTPNSIIEAMSHGVPVIASAVGGIPDLLGCAHGRECDAGLLVPVGDDASLARAMLRLAEDGALRARMGAAARRRYERAFSPAAVVPLMLETYGRLAARRQTGDAVSLHVGRDAAYQSCAQG
jgi:glycosyltransferase involved in cell wall biosynthesis